MPKILIFVSNGNLHTSDITKRLLEREGYETPDLESNQRVIEGVKKGTLHRIVVGLREQPCGTGGIGLLNQLEQNKLTPPVLIFTGGHVERIDYQGKIRYLEMPDQRGKLIPYAKELFGDPKA